MNKSRAPAVRELLRQHPDGLTILEIRKLLNMMDVDKSIMLRCLEAMPDAYIDRWIVVRKARGQYSAVWCVVVPPTNCPHPTRG